MFGWKKKNKVLLLATVGIMLLVSLNFFQDEVRNFFYLISSPFQKVLLRGGQKFSSFWEMLIKIKGLSEENQRFLNGIKAKNAQIALLKEQEKENEVLREALGMGLPEEFKLVLAEVIGKEIDRDFILIDKGSLEGISPGLAVITQNKVLLGRVDQVFSSFSRVMLISSPESSFSAKIQEKEIAGVLKGGGRLRLSLSLVPQEEEIEIGDRVVTTSLGGIFPKGFWVGEISRIEKSDLAPFQRAEIRPAFDLKKLEMIFLIFND